MAPHAKVVVLYDQPFWRSLGLSGRIVSQFGPLVEAHDHSGPEGYPPAIFGFVGWPHGTRVEVGEGLEKDVLIQLKRCFGADSPSPLAIHIQDWATNPWITSSGDLTEPMRHPDIGPAMLRQAHADGRLWFAGSETAARSPGLIEGAIDAAEQITSAILD